MTDLFTPTQFGAVGDGQAPDTAPLQRLFDEAHGKTVIFPDSTRIYRISRLIVRSGTRIIGQVRIRPDNTVTGASNVVLVEPDANIDSLILDLPSGPLLRRGITLTDRNRVSCLSVTSQAQASSPGGQLDGMLRIRGEDVWVGSLVARNVDRPINVRDCRRLTIESVDIVNYLQGSLFVDVDGLQVGSYACRNVPPIGPRCPEGSDPEDCGDTSPSPMDSGHYGIAISRCRNVVFSGAVVENARSHGIRVNNPSENVTFIAPIIRRSGRSGFKAGETSSPDKVFGLTLVSPMILDSGSREMGLNSQGIRLTSVENSHIVGPTIARRKNRFSANDGIKLNDCSNVTIDNLACGDVASHGILFSPTRGDVNRIFVNNATILACGGTGILIPGRVPGRETVYRNIIIKSAYIKGCGQHGLHLTTNARLAQPVLLDGFIADTVLQEKLIETSSRNIIDRLETGSNRVETEVP